MPPTKKYCFHPNGAEDHVFDTFEDTKSYMLTTLGRDEAFNSPHEVLESVREMTNKGPVEPVAPYKDPADGTYYEDDSKKVVKGDFDMKKYFNDSVIYEKQHARYIDTS